MVNPKVQIKENKILFNNRYVLRKVTFDLQTEEGYQTQHREVYDRGNGSTILLYNKKHKSIILTKQFRIPTYLNGNDTGMMIEACAGQLDNDNPEDCIRRETEEETGYRISTVQKIFEAYMSPGSVTEIIHFFVAEYSKDMKKSEGGGLKDEQENIEVLELPFSEALHLIQTGEIKDAKTIMLLQYAQLNNIFI